jgi:hypothetical protein
MATLGYIGEKLDLLVRQGATLGPFTVTLTITDAAAGKFQFGMTDEATAAIPAGETLKDAASVYVWDMELEDASGRVLPLYYGDCKVFREVTRV